MKKLSIVVPCYNEEETINLFFVETEKAIKKIEGLEAEYIFVDDGSSDKTLSLLKELNKKDNRVKYISFSRNFGKEAAIAAGFKKANGDYIVLMDADLQDPPAMLPEMYSYLKSGDYDSVATRRVTRKGEPPIRSFFARKFYKLINKSSDAQIVDGARDYRMMTRQFLNEVLKITEYNRFTKGIFGWVGFKTKWLEYKNVERVAGETKWSFKNLFKYAIDGIFAFSTLPLKLLYILSFICFFLAGLGAVSLVTILILSAFNLASTALAVTILLITAMAVFTSVQLFAVTVVAKYGLKTYEETKNRAIYIVKETEEGNV
jgi:glycosyltransferase involved in cell wall biosynthesis